MPVMKALSADQYIEFWKSITPKEYHSGIIEFQNQGSGYEVFYSLASVASRLSQVAERIDADMHIATATGGTFSTTTLNITRSGVGPTEAPISFTEGSLFSTPEGEIFVAEENVAWALGENSTKTMDVKSFRKSYQANVRENSISVILAPLPSGQQFNGMSFTHAAATGGRPSMLDALGRNRGVIRKTGESDEELRKRIRSLRDILTPGAMQRQINASINPFGALGIYRLGIEVGPHADGDFAADEPSTDISYYCPERYMTAGHFYAHVEEIGEQIEEGLVADFSAADFDAVDSYDSVRAAVYIALKEALDSKKPAGVSFHVVVDPDLKL